MFGAAPVEGAVAASGGDSQKDAIADQALSHFLAVSKRNIMHGVTMSADFAATVPKLGKTAFLKASRVVHADGKIDYEVISSEGDPTIKKEVIARFMAAEAEGPTPAQVPAGSIAITPENYKFKYKGAIDTNGTQRAYIFEINPRKKRIGLFKGEIWVDEETGLGVREAGRFVKSPSVFLKDIQFTREFQIMNEVAVPSRIETEMDTRFWGKAKLEVRYSDWSWKEPSPNQVARQ
jgi:hypothetical protein